MSQLNNTDWCLERAGKLIDEARAKLERGRSLTLSVELLDALRALDEHYKEYCAELDQDDDELEGTTYDNEYGPGREFYFDADLWHDISIELRKMKEEPTE